MSVLKLVSKPFAVHADIPAVARICSLSHAVPHLRNQCFRKPFPHIPVCLYAVRGVRGTEAGTDIFNSRTGRSTFSTRKRTKTARSDVLEHAKGKPMNHMKEGSSRKSSSRVASETSRACTHGGRSDSSESEGILEQQVDFDFHVIEEHLSNVVKRLESKLDQLEISRPHVGTFEEIPIQISGGSRRLGDLGQVVLRGSSVARITLFSDNTLSKVASSLRKFDESWLITEEGTNCLRIQLPKMTEEVLEKFMTDAKALTEESKVDVRRVRQSARNKLHSFWQRSKSIDETTRRQNEVYLQQLTDKAVAQCAALLSAKLKKLSSQLA